MLDTLQKLQSSKQDTLGLGTREQIRSEGKMLYTKITDQIRSNSDNISESKNNIIW